MAKYITEERCKELLSKRKYFREHPEEAYIEALKRKDDGVVIITLPADSKEKENK